MQPKGPVGLVEVHLYPASKQKVGLLEVLPLEVALETSLYALAMAPWVAGLVFLMVLHAVEDLRKETCI